MHDAGVQFHHYQIAQSTICKCTHSIFHILNRLILGDDGGDDSNKDDDFDNKDNNSDSDACDYHLCDYRDLMQNQNQLLNCTQFRHPADEQ